MLHDLLDDRLNHVVVGLQQVIARHPRLPRKPRRNHHHVTPSRPRVISTSSRNPGSKRIGPSNRPRLHHIQSLTRRRPVQNIRQHHIRQLQIDNSLRGSRPHKPATHHRNFFPTHRHRLRELCALLFCDLCVNSFSCFLLRRSHALHILDNRGSKCRSPHLGSPWHQPFQIV